jgi:hypothetical protein
MPNSFMSNRKLLDFIDRIQDNRISKSNLAQELQDLNMLEIINERLISIIGW